MGARPLIVLLAHNEEACIASTVRELHQRLPDVDVLVVDDGSRDRTAAVARDAGACVVSHPFNLGVAAGESTGLLHALRHGYTRVIRMDGDGQHDPESIPALLAELERGTELVIGSRFAGITSFRSTWLRRFGSGFLSRLLSVLCKQRITDPTSGFRGFGGRAIAYFSRVHPHDYPEPESLLMASRKGFSIQEVAARMRPRRTGVSSLTPWKSAYFMVKVSFALLLERARTA